MIWQKDWIDARSVLKNDPGRVVDWIEATTGINFRASIYDILRAEMELNRLMALRQYVSLQDFLNMLGIDTGDIVYDDIGWSLAAWDVYGYSFIDFWELAEYARDGEVLYFLDYPFPPHDDYLSL